VFLFLWKVIPECEKPSDLLQPMETRHLVLRTKMHTKEFNGIILLLNNCPNLETLGFDILTPCPFSVRFLHIYAIKSSHILSLLNMHDFLLIFCRQLRQMKASILKRIGCRREHVRV